MARKPEAELPVLPSAKPPQRFADEPFVKSERSTEFIKRMQDTARRPKRLPLEHWQHVLKTSPEGSIAAKYAKEAIAELERKLNPNNA